MSLVSSGFLEDSGGLWGHSRGSQGISGRFQGISVGFRGVQNVFLGISGDFKAFQWNFSWSQRVSWSAQDISVSRHSREVPGGFRGFAGRHTTCVLGGFREVAKGSSSNPSGTLQKPLETTLKWFQVSQKQIWNHLKLPWNSAITPRNFLFLDAPETPGIPWTHLEPQ